MSRTPWVSFDGKNCSGCKHLNDRGYCEFTACIIPCTVITTIPETKPQTNGDRIRRMSDEELAIFMFCILTVDGSVADAPIFGNHVEAWREWFGKESKL